MKEMQPHLDLRVLFGILFFNIEISSSGLSPPLSTNDIVHNLE